MITGFSIILNNEIIYCSNEGRYNCFEMVLYLKELLTNINPKNTWRAHKISFDSIRFKRENMIIKHIVLNGNHLFYCIIGDFSEFSAKCYELLKEFQKKVEIYYNLTEIVNESYKKVLFKTIIENIVDHLLKEYLDPLDNEDFKVDTLYNDFKENKIIYCGISAEGLPIISQLFNNSLLKNLNNKNKKETREIFISNLSSKLATLVINAMIRANSHIKVIHLRDLEENCFKFIFFGELNDYTVDIIGSGNYFQIQNIFKDIITNLSKYEILQNNFTGDLKPYKDLDNYVEEIILITNK